MAIAYVSGATGTESESTGSWSATTGNCIVVGVWLFGDSCSITSVTDTAGNTYSLIGTYNNGANYYLFLYLAQNITGHASNAVTLNGVTGSGPRICAGEFSGVSTTAAQDTGYTPAGKQTYPSPSTSNSDDTAVDNEVVVGFFFCPVTAPTWSDSGGSTKHLQTSNGQSALASVPVATAGAATISLAYDKDDYAYNLVRALAPASASSQYARPASLYFYRQLGS